MIRGILVLASGTLHAASGVWPLKVGRWAETRLSPARWSTPGLSVAGDHLSTDHPPRRSSSACTGVIQRSKTTGPVMVRGVGPSGAAWSKLTRPGDKLVRGH